MKSGKRNAGGLVYSTAHGRMCPGCSKPVADCACRQLKAKPNRDGLVQIRLETKGRKGKGVTVIAGLALDSDDLLQFGKELKQRCGTGGTVKDGEIEIQGEHRALIAAELATRGLKHKIVGG